MRREQAPILEYDAAREAVIEPSDVIDPIDAPEHLVFCFFQDVIDGLVASGVATEIARCRSEMGWLPIHRLEFEGRPFALMQPGIGGPFVAAMFEETIALGFRKFIACGGAGVLDPNIDVGRLIVPRAAVRDEGASYHYLPPSREVESDPTALAAIEHVLTARGSDYLVGKTWTTDAFYRETRERVRRRRDEGCLVVEMEAATFFAVARFRGVPIAQILYAGDDVGSEEWDARGWHGARTVREQLVWLAAEACLTL